VETRLNRFVDACRASGYEFHFVVDGDEPCTKWNERVTKQVQGEKRDMPLSTATLLCDIIRMQGAKLYNAAGLPTDCYEAARSRRR